MILNFSERLKTWRESRNLTSGEAAAYVNSLQTGEPIVVSEWERIEAGLPPNTADRLLLDFFMGIPDVAAR
jgi:hypothetical protein